MKANDPMNWTKRQTQQYGLFMGILGSVLGSIITYGLTVIIPLL
jgi:hypothetical protein